MILRPAAVGRAAAFVALSALAGCVRAPPPDLSRDPAPLLAQVRAAQGGVTSCRGSARLALSSPDLSGSLDAWVAAETSGRLRVEVFDFFGNPAAVLVAGGGRFALLDARAGTFHRGDDTPENLARLLPVPLGARELARVICGSAPILDGQPVAAEPGDGVVLLELAGPAGRQVLGVGEGASIVSASFLPGARGGTAWKAAFSIFRHPGGRRFPTEVELRGGGAEIGLRWKDDLEVNGAPDDALFGLDPPRGARVIDLAPGEGPPPIDLPIRPETQGRP
ncbi:MAG: hypothetical protein RJA59_1336 [Pseudomonadota bacterium]